MDTIADNDDEDCVHVNELMHTFGDWTLRVDVIVVYSFVYSVIFIAGLLGNSLLIENIIRHRRYRSVPNLFLVNLALSQLLLCITALPITPVLAFVKRWVFGEWMCKLVPLCQAISVLISSYCLCFIAVDRYRNIVGATRRRDGGDPWTLVHALSLIIGAWLLSILISVPLVTSQQLKSIRVLNDSLLCGTFCGEYGWINEQSKLCYGITMLTVQFLVPISIMCFCYSKILQKVRKDWIVTEGSMLTPTQQAQASIRKRRVMYVLILMLVCFVVSWTPLTLVNMLRDFGFDFFDNQMYFTLLNVHALANSSVVWNPMLYFWMGKRHRRALKDDMYWFTNARRQNQYGNTGGVLRLCAPNPSVAFIYRRSSASIVSVYRRGTLADPTQLRDEQAIRQIRASCFLLVPLMPFANGQPLPSSSSSRHLPGGGVGAIRR